MLFAPVRHLANSLAELNCIIKNNSPILTDSNAELAKKLAITHNEFNVIHPFRDGNGRTIRLFLDLWVDTLGFEPINYGNRELYLLACVAGAKGDQNALQKIIIKGLNKG